MHVQPPLQLYPTPVHLYPPPSNFTSPPASPSRKVAGLGCFPSLALAPTLSGPHPSVFLWCRSPRAGLPLRTGRVAGGSTSVTAEAGKLPTLNVRPFWPFQIVESRLWEEARVKGAGSQGRVGAGPRSTFSSQAVRYGATSAWRKGCSFLSNTKGLYASVVALAGRPGLW